MSQIYKRFKVFALTVICSMSVRQEIQSLKARVLEGNPRWSTPQQRRAEEMEPPPGLSASTVVFMKSKMNINDSAYW